MYGDMAFIHLKIRIPSLHIVGWARWPPLGMAVEGRWGCATLTSAPSILASFEFPYLTHFSVNVWRLVKA
jgi:hypothetical protein